VGILVPVGEDVLPRKRGGVAGGGGDIRTANLVVPRKSPCLVTLVQQEFGFVVIAVVCVHIEEVAAVVVVIMPSGSAEGGERREVAMRGEHPMGSRVAAGLAIGGYERTAAVVGHAGGMSRSIRTSRES